ncbi:MAG: chemotaxis protein CheD [Longimicrobiaceae bacterium]
MKPRQIFVKVAHHATGGPGDVLITLGLGSCVAILLHDRQARVGGLAHVLLPEPALARDRHNFAKFAATAVPMLMDELAALGARGGRIEARLVGGASMFTALMVPGSLNMGERNVRAAREALRKAGVPLLGEAVGGDYGRSVRFAAGDGRTVVSSVGKPDVVL